jgi:hypothetical protein
VDSFKGARSERVVTRLAGQAAAVKEIMLQRARIDFALKNILNPLKQRAID